MKIPKLRSKSSLPPARALYTVTQRVRGMDVALGAVVAVNPSTTAFLRFGSWRKGFLIKLNAQSFPDELVKFLQQHPEIDEIHHIEDDKLHVTTPTLLSLNGMPGDFGRGHQLYLGIEHYSERPLTYRKTWTKHTIRLS